MSLISVAECHKSLHHGLVPAVPVTLSASGQIDSAAHARYVAYMAEQPIAGVGVWAHTGRGLLLSREQRIEVLRAWREGLGPGKTLIAGVGGSPQHAGDARAFVDSALSMAASALENGAQALLIYPPTPFRQSAQGDELVLDYHKQLASLGAPLILFYLYEAAGGISYSPGLLRNLFALPEVVGIKLATLDSVMTFQDVAAVIRQDFPQKLLITGEDRFLGYSLMCGAQAALIGMGAACTGLQRELMDAHFQGRAAEFLALSRLVDELAEVLFVAPMEGYIRRVLWTMVNERIIERESSYDPWGPELRESEFAEIGNVLQRVTQFESPRRK
jgi:4-hydroxy-tetrahydrodipicolinate synthase